VNHDKFQAKLSAYKDGELNENLWDQISRHLQSCDACREELKEFDKIDSLVEGMPEISVPETFTAEIIAKSQTVKSHRRWEMVLPQTMIDRLMLVIDSIFDLLPGDKSRGTGSLDEFGDFPPLSIGHAYFSLIGQEK
jgi:predicted anti-sigma-YlaC factor YlaD